MEFSAIVAWLRETDPARLADLWLRADQTRQRFVGGDVHLRGLIEMSNFCVRLCAYCGLRAENRLLPRYRMTEAEILHCVRLAVDYGYGTVVLQAGEDPGIAAEAMGHVVRRVKAETNLAVTLSLGEREEAELAACAQPAPIATCSASKRPTGRCTTASIRRGPASAAIASPCWARCGAWATKWAAA